MFEEITIPNLVSYDDLSYNDYADDYIEVLHKGVFVGAVAVFTDSSHEERSGAEAEYIVINDEMLYLDSIKKN